jgi:hypothetical protein
MSSIAERTSSVVSMTAASASSPIQFFMPSDNDAHNNDVAIVDIGAPLPGTPSQHGIEGVATPSQHNNTNNNTNSNSNGVIRRQMLNGPVTSTRPPPSSPTITPSTTTIGAGAAYNNNNVTNSRSLGNNIVHHPITLLTHGPASVAPSASTCTTCANSPRTPPIDDMSSTNVTKSSVSTSSTVRVKENGYVYSGMAHGRLLMEMIDAQPHTVLRQSRRHTPCDDCMSYRWARTFNAIYDRLMAHDIGSRIHHSHFQTWPRILLTLGIITATACGLVGVRIAGISDPDFTTPEYGIVNNAAFIFSLSTLTVLYGVLTGLDYTRFGTLIELAHNVTELYLAIVSFGYDKTRYQWTIVGSTALFMIQSIPILRLSIKEQFNWAGM